MNQELVYDRIWVGIEGGLLLYKPTVQAPDFVQEIDLGWTPTSIAFTNGATVIVASPDMVALLRPDDIGMYGVKEHFERKTSGIITSLSWCPPGAVACLMLTADRSRILAVLAKPGGKAVLGQWVQPPGIVHQILDRTPLVPVVAIAAGYQIHTQGLYTQRETGGLRRTTPTGTYRELPFKANFIGIDLQDDALVVAEDNLLYRLEPDADTRSGYPVRLPDDDPIVGLGMAGNYYFHIVTAKQVGKFDMHTRQFKAVDLASPNPVWAATPIDAAVRLFGGSDFDGDGISNRTMIPGTPRPPFVPEVNPLKV